MPVYSLGIPKQCYSIERYQELLISEPPSCVQFWPEDPYYFVLGTYKLETNLRDRANPVTGSPKPLTKVKSGSIRLFQTVSDTILQEVNESRKYLVDAAVFDLQFSPSEKDLFAISTSNGMVITIKIVWGDEVPHFEIMREFFTKYHESVSITCLTWLPERSCAIAAATDRGEVVIFNPHENSDNVVVPCHSEETWCLCWYNRTVRRLPPHEATEEAPFVGSNEDGPRIFEHPLYQKGGLEKEWPFVDVGQKLVEDGSSISHKLLLASGGDDSRLVVSRIGSMVTRGDVLPRRDLDESHHLQDLYYDWSTDSKTHKAGVTAIVHIGFDILVTGSYDEHIRVVEAERRSRKCKLYAEEKVGGGVWQLRIIDGPHIKGEGPWYSSNGKEIMVTFLASCMHEGAKIVEIQRTPAGIWTIEVKLHFGEVHQSMVYACDCEPWKLLTNPETRERRIISTSYYDKRICLWKTRLP